jgi:hypothetical protein
MKDRLAAAYYHPLGAAFLCFAIGLLMIWVWRRQITPTDVACVMGSSMGIGLGTWLRGPRPASDAKPTTQLTLRGIAASIGWPLAPELRLTLVGIGLGLLVFAYLVAITVRH